MKDLDDDRAAFVRALRADYIGEVIGEVDYRVQALVALRRAVRERARELAAVEVETRRLLGDELAKHGVVMERMVLLRGLAWAGLLPLKLVLPTRVWVAFLLRVTTRAVASFERQQARFGARNPALFAHLVEHEVRQRDWARGYLAAPRAAGAPPR